MIASLALCMALLTANAQSSPVLGTWSQTGRLGETTFAFATDGTYRKTTSGVKADRVTGKYSLSKDQLTLTPDDGSDPIRYRVRVAGETLTMTDADGGTLTLTRQPGPISAGFGGDTISAPGLVVGRMPLTPDLSRLKPSGTGHILYSHFEMQRDPVSKIPVPHPRIYIMRGDGGDKALFIDPKGKWMAGQPRWSPTGTSIVFTSNFEMPRSAFFQDIFQADLRTGAVRRITGFERTPNPNKMTGQIFAAIIDDRNPKRPKPARFAEFTYQGAGGKTFRVDDYKPPAAPPGEIAPPIFKYSFNLKNVPVGTIWIKCWMGRHFGDLRVCRVTKGKIGKHFTMRLSNGNILMSHPSISPDGRFLVAMGQLAYYKHALAKDKREIFDPSRDPTDILNMIKPRKPVEWERKAPAFRGIDSVNVIDVATGVSLASFNPMKFGGFPLRDPMLSPDGRFLAMATGTPMAESIVVCSIPEVLANRIQFRAVVQGQIKLAQGYVGNLSPAWSPDGRRLAFIRYSTDRLVKLEANLWVVNLDGSGLKQLTRVKVNQCVGIPSWSPDGSRIAFTLMTGKREIISLLDLILLNFTADVWTVRADGADLQQLTNDGRSAEPSWGP